MFSGNMSQNEKGYLKGSLTLEQILRIFQIIYEEKPSLNINLLGKKLFSILSLCDTLMDLGGRQNTIIKEKQRQIKE